MKLTVQVVLHTDDDSDAISGPVVREVLTVQRETLSTDMLGLQLAEAKDLLEAVQDTREPRGGNRIRQKGAAAGRSPWSRPV